MLLLAWLIVEPRPASLHSLAAGEHCSLLLHTLAPHAHAQVHPELLTKALLRSAEKRGGSLRLAAVTGVDASGGRLAAVTLRDAASGQEERLEADAFVFAMGEAFRCGESKIVLLLLAWCLHA